MERMGTASTAECGRIRQALKLCDKFLNNRQGSPQELDKLKADVAAALRPATTRPGVNAQSPRSGGKVGGKTDIPNLVAQACPLPVINSRQDTVC